MFNVPFAPDRWNEIIPNLFQGGHDIMHADGRYDSAIVADEFDLVLSFHRRAGFGPPDGVEHHHAAIPDGPLTREDLAKVRLFADIAELAVRSSRRVLNRCQAGYNRSGLLTAFTLMRLGYSADDAIDLIREKRSPYALCNEHFVIYIFAEGVRLEREMATTVPAHVPCVLDDLGGCDLKDGA